MHSEMGLVRQNTIQKTVRTVHLSVLIGCAQLSVHNTAQNSSDNIPSYLQTTIIAQILSVGGKGHSRSVGHRFWYQSKANMRLPISD